MARPKGSVTKKGVKAVEKKSVKKAAAQEVYTVTVSAVRPISYTGKVVDIADEQITLLVKKQRSSKFVKLIFRMMDLVCAEYEGKKAVGTHATVTLVPDTRVVAEYKAVDVKTVDGGVTIILTEDGKVVEISGEFITEVLCATEEREEKQEKKSTGRRGRPRKEEPEDDDDEDEDEEEEDDDSDDSSDDDDDDEDEEEEEKPVKRGRKPAKAKSKSDDDEDDEDEDW